jgi:hypothetical protein
VDLRQALIRDLGDLLARIDHAAKSGPLALRLDDDAMQVWETWYTAMPRTIHSRRLDTYGMRLMILLSLSRGNLDTVSADTVRRVCTHADRAGLWTFGQGLDNLLRAKDVRYDKATRRYVLTEETSTDA